jgi:hypothetical protein
MAAVSGWAALLARRENASGRGDAAEAHALDALQREFEQNTLRPAQVRFRLLAPSGLVAQARVATDLLRDQMGIVASGPAVVTSAYRAAYKEMLALARTDLGSPG